MYNGTPMAFASAYDPIYPSTEDVGILFPQTTREVSIKFLFIHVS